MNIKLRYLKALLIFVLFSKYFHSICELAKHFSLINWIKITMLLCYNTSVKNTSTWFILEMLKELGKMHYLRLILVKAKAKFLKGTYIFVSILFFLITRSIFFFFNSTWKEDRTYISKFVQSIANVLSIFIEFYSNHVC